MILAVYLMNTNDVMKIIPGTYFYSNPGQLESKKKVNKKQKLKNKRTVIDGITFDSKKEAKRYLELKVFLENGLIEDLETQVTFELIPKQKLSNGKSERAVSYIADFVYQQDGKTVVEDVKGYRGGATYALYVIKRKLMLLRHNIEIIEI